MITTENIVKPYKPDYFLKFFLNRGGGVEKVSQKSIQIIHINLKLYVILKVSKEEQFRADEFLNCSQRRDSCDKEAYIVKFLCFKNLLLSWYWNILNYLQSRDRYAYFTIKT